MPRGNSDNLRTPTSEEARENGRKGGVASGKARREKKAMREMVQVLLSLKTPDKVSQQLKKMGISKPDLNNQTAMLVAVLNQAMKGDVRAAEFIRDTAGEGIDQTLNESDEKVRIVDDI